MHPTNDPNPVRLRLLAAVLLAACAKQPVVPAAPVRPTAPSPPVDVHISFHGFVTDDFLVDGKKCAPLPPSYCWLAPGNHGARTKLDTGLHIFEARGPFGIYRYTRDVRGPRASFLIAGDNVDPVPVQR